MCPHHGPTIYNYPQGNPQAQGRALEDFLSAADVRESDQPQQRQRRAPRAASRGVAAAVAAEASAEESLLLSIGATHAASAAGDEYQPDAEEYHPDAEEYQPDAEEMDEVASV